MWAVRHDGGHRPNKSVVLGAADGPNAPGNICEYPINLHAARADANLPRPANPATSQVHMSVPDAPSWLYWRYASSRNDHHHQSPARWMSSEVFFEPGAVVLLCVSLYSMTPRHRWNEPTVSVRGTVSWRVQAPSLFFSLPTGSWPSLAHQVCDRRHCQSSST